jgi:hypothetical protein
MLEDKRGLMSKSKSNSGCTIGSSGTVFIVFLILKLTHVIDWSWWWVTAPVWMPLGIAAVLLCIAGFIVIMKGD